MPNLMDDFTNVIKAVLVFVLAVIIDYAILMSVGNMLPTMFASDQLLLIIMQGGLWLIMLFITLGLPAMILLSNFQRE